MKRETSSLKQNQVCLKQKLLSVDVDQPECQVHSYDEHCQIERQMVACRKA